jgi:hypothetical protein
MVAFVSAKMNKLNSKRLVVELVVNIGDTIRYSRHTHAHYVADSLTVDHYQIMLHFFSPNKAHLAMASVKQQHYRRLMKEQKSKASSKSTQKVDHPLAK